MEMRGSLPSFLAQSETSIGDVAERKMFKNQNTRTATWSTKSSDSMKISTLQPAEMKFEGSESGDMRLRGIVNSLKAKIRAMEKQRDLEHAIMEEFRLEAGQEKFTERRVLFLKAQLLCMERRIQKLEHALEHSAPPRTYAISRAASKKAAVLEAESVIAAAVERMREAHTSLVKNSSSEEIDTLCEVLRETCYQLLMTWRDPEAEQIVQDFTLAPVQPKGCCNECQKEIEKWVRGCWTACNIRIDQVQSEIQKKQFPR